MALDYDGANAGVFTRTGKLVKYINSYLTQASTTMPAELKAIADLYEAADLTLQIAGLYGTYDGFKGSIVGIRQSLATFVDATLLDRDTVITQLVGPPPASLPSIVSALHQQMLNDAKTIKRSTVTLGSTTPSATNTGNGVVLLTKVLDGFNAPLTGGQAHIRYNGLDSELAVPSETMTFVCVSDSMRDGSQEGAEVLSWSGGVAGLKFDYRTEGSGTGPALTVSTVGSALLSNGTFESFASNVPASWTIDNGSAGTHILQQTPAGADVYRGASSLKFAGTGAQATIGISQTVLASSLKSRRRYLVGLRVKASAVPGAGQIECNFTGTGYTASSPTTEVQDFQISGTPTGGTYTISWVGPTGGTQTTSGIAYNATSATVQAALRLLTGLESVTVATQAGSPPDVTHRITFHGTVGNINQLTGNATGLTGGAPVITPSTVTQGVEGEKIVLAAAAFPTTWSLRWFWINMPVVIPSDWKLVLQITGTLSNTVNVFFDDVTLAEVVYHGGVGAVSLAGATRFVAGDTFTVTVANDAAGKFQEFYRHHYQAQLPSSGSPNIADALAT